MRMIKCLGLSLCFVALATSAGPQAADSVIRGTVADSGGRPIAGALVKATLGAKSVSRYTGADGKYELTVATGTYALIAEAFGFAVERKSKDTAAGGAVDFELAPGWSVMQFTGADIDRLIPDDHANVRLLKSTCINCHALDVMLRRRGATEAQWRTYIEKQMPLRYGRGFNASEAEWKVITGELVRLFGPKAQYFGAGAQPPAREQVQRPRMAPEVARATFLEYTLPNPRSMPHSLAVDAAGSVWIAGWDNPTNAVLRFDTATEQFKTYPVPTPNAVPHTPCVTRDGRVWMALNARGTAKVALIDPKTDQLVELKWDGRPSGTHSCQEDRDGNVWFSSLGDGDSGFYVYDPKTAQFRSYKYRLPGAYPPGSKALIDTAAGDPPPQQVRAGMYDVDVDSTGAGWGGAYSMGMIVRVDPKTGDTKEYFPPETPQIRGIFVDSQDNVWFAAFDSHKIGKLNPKTGEMKFYQPPTEKASPYSFVEDTRRGVIWFGDLNGNNLTRFDPRTETFIEYPFPSRNVNLRLGIGIDPQGRIWFTEFLNGRIGALDPGDAPRTTTSGD